MRRYAAGLVLAALLAACTDHESTGDDATTTTTAPGTTTSTEPLAEGSLDRVALALEEVAELEEPVALAARPGSPHLYVAEKGGRVVRIAVEEDEFGDDEGEVTYEVVTPNVLDISDEVINEGERGLLGIAFSSDGRKLYLDYTREPDGHTVVVEYTLGDGLNLDEDSRRELLVVEQPYPNHNGGHLAIGPDGYLYIALGDGGDGGDPHGHGQDTSTLLGSILRIDPEGGAEDGPPYAIPPGNPFAGEDGSAPEIWLYGVRNPWRFSFDLETGDLWVGDVGQNAFEEIDRLPATGGFEAGRGDNLGWDEMEGTHPFDGGDNPPGGVLPIFEYGREDGCSVIGGYVYRGEEIPELQGTYVYADYCGRGVRGLQLDGDTLIDARAWDLDVTDAFSLGEGDDGELYVLMAGGRVVKLVAA